MSLKRRRNPLLGGIDRNSNSKRRKKQKVVEMEVQVVSKMSSLSSLLEQRKSTEKHGPNWLSTARL